MEARKHQALCYKDDFTLCAETSIWNLGKLTSSLIKPNAPKMVLNRLSRAFTREGEAGIELSFHETTFVLAGK
jgi:hypothetical protein